MKNTLNEIGGWKIKDPSKVLKLGFVLDAYKLPQLEKLWCQALAKIKHKDACPEDMFHQYEKEEGNLVYSFRFYTPASNRTRELN